MPAQKISTRFSAIAHFYTPPSTNNAGKPGFLTNFNFSALVKQGALAVGFQSIILIRK